MPPEQDVTPAIADRYRLRSEIGSGGMGTVWAAEDTLLRRDVAVKEIALPRTVAADERESIRKRVLREARAAAALNHANAVTVFDVVEEDGKAFIVMECIAGRTLEELVTAEGPLSDDRLIQIADDVLSALEVAHRAGIVHRDVKPANVMITHDGRTKLADFGIASVKDDPKITASGLILGSPSYMAPEQATHGRSGPEADLWGLGATLYFALEGVPPFTGQGPIPTLTAVVGDEPRPMQRQSAIGHVIEALLAKDPGERPGPQKVREMMAAAPGRAPGTPTAALEEPRTTTLREPPAATTPATNVATEPASPTIGRDRKPWLWLAGLAAAILVGVLAAMLFSDRDQTDLADEPRAKQKNEGGAGEDETTEEAPADTAAGTDTAAVPEGWTTYEDPSLGYEVAHPAEWSVEGEGSQNTYFRDDETGTYLQIAWQQPPNELGPEGAWEAQSDSFAQRKENYDEIRIDPTTFKGMDAAEWEFTYEEGGASLHGLDLGFITTDGSTGMALFFQTREENWASSQELFEQLKASFRPPA